MEDCYWGEYRTSETCVPCRDTPWRVRRKQTMKTVILLCALSCITPVAGAQQSSTRDTTGTAAALHRSRAAAQELLGRVRTVLMKTMADGGAVNAVTVCADTAQEIARRMQTENGLSVRRVSDRWRNAADIPDGYEADALKRFAGMKSEGLLRESTEHSEYVADSAGGRFRYLRPIFVQDMCLTCHGDRGTMKDLINTVLQERYPADRAVGYRKGDLRGAVSVTIPAGQ